MCRPSRKVPFAACRRGHASPTVRPMRKARDPISRLRTAIDCLPARTREAMLDGIRATERELRTLEHLLEASLAAEGETDLGAAIAEYRASVGGILARRLKPGR